MEYILQTQNLTKKFSKQLAVNDVSMNIAKGDIYGFVGKNGAGKTTLMKIVTGLSSETSGNIKLFNSDNLLAGRKMIGSIIEYPTLYGTFTAKQNLEIQQKLCGNKDPNKISELLKLVDLENTGKKKAKKFSLGMKQRLGIAMTLMNNPKFLILDEPMNGLDPSGIKEIRDVILKLNKEKGLTVLISSHILGELAKISTRYGIINNGNLVEEFTTEELKDKLKSSLSIKVNDIEKTVKIIENDLKTTNYKIIDEKIIKLYDNLDKSSQLNSILVKNDIMVEYINHNQENEEDYFINLMEGKIND